jgi:hypothetical protein
VYHAIGCPSLRAVRLGVDRDGDGASTATNATPAPTRRIQPELSSGLEGLG